MKQEADELVRTAKGRLRMFLLRPLAGGAAPAMLGDIERTPLTS